MKNRQIDQLGYFEFRDPLPGMSGVVIGAPHGLTDPETALLAKHISERTGAALIVAYGFKSRRISVAQPAARRNSNYSMRIEPANRLSVFHEFKQILGEISNGEVALYVELRSRAASDGLHGIRVTSSGFTFEESKIIEQLYIAASDRIGKAKAIQKLPISIDQDQVGSNTWRIRHHGVLMLAEKGLSLRIPEQFVSGLYSSIYGEILATWVNDIKRLIQETRRGVPHIEVKLMDFGRLDTIPPRERAGIVIGAPHGSYDPYTAGITKQLAFRTGWAAVIARGFTPTESGDGMRINVNRPTERHVLSDREFETERARTTYEQFRRCVLSAAGGNLEVYIDVHHNNGSRIEVATVGVSKEEARVIKTAYHAARDEILAGHPDLAVVALAIEPLDRIEVGAWAAKTNGILTAASRGLHFELPADGVMSSGRHRRIYTQILAQLFEKLPAALRLARRDLLSHN